MNKAGMFFYRLLIMMSVLTLASYAQGNGDISFKWFIYVVAVALLSVQEKERK